MDLAIGLKKDGKSIPIDFDQRWQKAVEKLRVAFQKLEDKYMIIWKAANNK